MGYNCGMSVYTITVTLTPEEDAALRARARYAGSTAEEVLGQAARHPLTATLSEAGLLDEYHRLVDLQIAGRLTEAQAAHLRDVEARLNELDAQDPVEQVMDARASETSRKLEEVLEALRRLPLRPNAA